MLYSQAKEIVEMNSLNKKILNTGVQDFIFKNLSTDIVSVLLKKPIFDEISQKELAQQLEARKKCEKKLPTWFESPKIYYPKKLHIEQSSSEKTALYKSQIVSGKSLFDLSGGFGVDSFFFSTKIDEIIYTEIDTVLAQITAHNFEILGAKNIHVISDDGISFLKRSKRPFDWIYLDPSRRSELKGKVFRIVDCVPNILEHLDALFEKSDNLLLKTAPLVDLSQGIKELRNVFEIHVVAVKNEVKELLWILKKGFKGNPVIKTANIRSTMTETFDFYPADETAAQSRFSLPQKYLYEPNAAILKSGAFKLIGQRFSLHKLHRHTHLYSSNKLIDFPGRSFVIEAVVDYGKKTGKELNLKVANIAIRNFPQSVAFIRKNLKIKDGGEKYLFFTKDHEQHLKVIRCRKTS